MELGPAYWNKIFFLQFLKWPLIITDTCSEKFEMQINENQNQRWSDYHIFEMFISVKIYNLTYKLDYIYRYYFVTSSFFFQCLLSFHFSWFYLNIWIPDYLYHWSYWGIFSAGFLSHLVILPLISLNLA